MLRHSLLIAGIFVSGNLCLADDPTAENDHPEIRAVLAAHEAAWNAYDVEALTELMAEDVDHIDSKGVLVSGRDAVSARYADVFSRFGESRPQLRSDTITIRLITEDVAIAVVEGELMIGDLDANRDATPFNLVSTIVLKLVDGEWKTTALRTTSIE